MFASSKPLPSEDLDHVLAHTYELWEEARGCSFFITGGTGFFGLWLIESLARANDVLSLGMRAVVLTRDPLGFEQRAPHLTARADVEVLVGDVRSFVFPPGRFTYLIHAAAETSMPAMKRAPDELFSTLVAGTTRVLDFAAHAGVTKLLLTSSGAVYGPQPPALARMPEDYAGAPDPLSASSTYGEGKRVAEHLCAVHASLHNYSAKIARCFAFVGPHLRLDAHYAIGNFIRDALQGGPVSVRDGTPVRSYLYASDLAIWLWTILFRGIASCAYNVGSDQTLTIGELAHGVGQSINRNILVQMPSPTDPGREISRYVPAIVRARDQLGLLVRVPLPEAIRKTAAWYA